MMKIAICEDIPAISAELEDMITDTQLNLKEVFKVEIFYSGESLIEYIKKGNTFDLIFLDIELGNINGIEVGEFIRKDLDDHITKIVYISSKNNYDRQLFEMQPLHFLSKPLDKEKVSDVIKLAIKVLEKENNLFTFKVGHKSYKIPIKEIIYFECLKREIKLVAVRETFHFYDTVKSILERLSTARFIQSHRSYIINYDNILNIGKDEIRVCNGDMLPISRLKAKEVKKLQIAYEEERYR